MAEISHSASSENIIQSALDISSDGTNEISIVLNDVVGDSTLAWGNVNTGTIASPNNVDQSGDGGTSGVVDTGKDVLTEYKYSTPSGFSGLKISDASGAMVIDDLMQKISTKVQVAAQMLSTANNIAKTASRILTQG